MMNKLYDFSLWGAKPLEAQRPFYMVLGVRVYWPSLIYVLKDVFPIYSSKQHELSIVFYPGEDYKVSYIPVFNDAFRDAWLEFTDILDWFDGLYTEYENYFRLGYSEPPSKARTPNVVLAYVFFTFVPSFFRVVKHFLGFWVWDVVPWILKLCRVLMVFSLLSIKYLFFSLLYFSRFAAIFIIEFIIGCLTYLFYYPFVLSLHFLFKIFTFFYKQIVCFVALKIKIAVKNIYLLLGNVVYNILCKTKAGTKLYIFYKYDLFLFKSRIIEGFLIIICLICLAIVFTSYIVMRCILFLYRVFSFVSVFVYVAYIDSKQFLFVLGLYIKSFYFLIKYQW